MKNFADLIIEAILKTKSYLCVGLDPQLRYFPKHLLEYCAKYYAEPFRAAEEAIFLFNKVIIDATVEYAMCYKPQIAFYEVYGSHGIKALERTIHYLESLSKLKILDAKREDGGDTAMAYARAYLGTVQVIGKNGELEEEVYSPCRVDAMTITNWIGNPNIREFMKIIQDNGKGLFVVDKTSFKPPSPYQEMQDKNGQKGWTKMAKDIAELGKSFIGENGYSSIGVVMGAQYPEEATLMKELIPNGFKLVPGFGFQGAGADDAVVAVNDDGFGIIPNNSRGTNYAWHPDFKSEFQCDPRFFSTAAGLEAKKCQDALSVAVKKKIGFLPWEDKKNPSSLLNKELVNSFINATIKVVEEGD